MTQVTKKLFEVIDTLGENLAYEKIMGVLDTDDKSDFLSWLTTEENLLDGKSVYDYMDDDYTYWEATDKLEDDLLDYLSFRDILVELAIWNEKLLGNILKTL